MVSAWAAQNALVLGQVKTDQKSNKITAIPVFLRVLALEGCIVTIDAMDCQKEIASRIRTQRADYVLSLKGNHENLHKEAEDYFYWAERQNRHEISMDECRTLEKGHGRIETRRCVVIEDVRWLTELEQWSDLRSI